MTELETPLDCYDFGYGCAMADRSARGMLDLVGSNHGRALADWQRERLLAGHADGLRDWGLFRADMARRLDTPEVAAQVGS